MTKTMPAAHSLAVEATRVRSVYILNRRGRHEKKTQPVPLDCSQWPPKSSCNALYAESQLHMSRSRTLADFYRYWYAYALPCAEGTSWIFDLRIQVERLTIGKSPGQTPFSCLEFVSAAAEFGFLYDGLNFSVGNARLD
jgi:hypothetical protein